MLPSVKEFMRILNLLFYNIFNSLQNGFILFLSLLLLDMVIRKECSDLNLCQTKDLLIQNLPDGRKR